LLFASAVTAQLFFNYVGNQEALNATLNVNLAVGAFFVGATGLNGTTNATFSFQLTNIIVVVPSYTSIVSPVNENPTFGGNYTEGYDFPSTCATTQWTAAGVSPATFSVDNFSTPIIPDEHTDLYAWSNFPAPYVTFDVYFGADPNATCSYIGSATTFSVQLCYFQNIPCSDTIGANGDGWLYIGGTDQTSAAFGFQLVANWSVSGSLYDMVVEDGADFFVPPLFNSDDFVATSGGTQFSYMEFNSFDLAGNVIFTVNDGVVDRGIYARTLSFEPTGEVAFDFQGVLSTLSSATGTYTWTVNGLFLQFSAFSDYDTTSLNNLYVEVVNLPDPSWYLTSYTFNTSVTSDDGDGSVNVVLVFTQYTTVAGMTVSSAPLTSHTTVAVPTGMPCPKACNGLGNCQNNGTCDCYNGYITDATLGCKTNVTVTLATVTGTSVPIKVATGTTGVTKVKVTSPTMPPVTLKPGATTGKTTAGTGKAAATNTTTKAGTPATKASASSSVLSLALVIVAALITFNANNLLVGSP